MRRLESRSIARSNLENTDREKLNHERPDPNKNGDGLRVNFFGDGAELRKIHSGSRGLSTHGYWELLLSYQEISFDAQASVAGNYGMPEGCTYQIGPKDNTFYRRELRSEAIS